MCGRARCSLRPDDILRASHLNGRRVRHVDMDRYRPSYNVSPGFYVPVIRRDDGHGADGQGQDGEPGAVLHCMKWGLIPSFTKKTEKPDHYKMFNARSESIREKASFRRLVPSNRCLVTVEGFYEWKKDGSKRQPYYIHLKDERSIVFAALFDSWKNSEGEVLYTFTILTTSSSSSLAWLHDRMPVILGNKESTEMWLNAPASSNLDTILKPYEETDLAWYPVTPAMGKPSFDGPECIKEIQLKTNESRPISEFFSKRAGGRQPESKLHSRTTKQDVAETNPPKLEEEEKVTEDSKNSQPLKNEDNDDTKPDVFVPHQQGAVNIPMKREYEEHSADTKHSDDNAGKRHASSLQKRLKDENGETVSVDMKQEYEQLSADTKHSDDEAGQQHSSPLLKRLEDDSNETVSADTEHSDDENGKQHDSLLQKRLKDDSDEKAVKQKNKTKKPSLDRTIKLGKGKSSAKKKPTGTGDKQPTLFSYFGKS